MICLILIGFLDTMKGELKIRKLVYEKKRFENIKKTLKIAIIIPKAFFLFVTKRKIIDKNSLIYCDRKR